ncbi:MAG: NAD-dependent epimerase/dehydratase family protein [Paludibacter sp.]
MKHTILGAGGSIGNALTYELLKSKADVRLVSRSNYSIADTESIKADLTSYPETMNSVKGSDIVYLCAGLPYDSNIWDVMWPKIMQNVMDACKSVGAKLIFFDNVYMYGKVEGKMVESTPFNPCSKKGEIRAIIASRLEAEIDNNNIKAIIARAADLYGPYITQNSVPYFMAIEKMMKGKGAQWLVDAQMPHSFSYTIDCAKGLSMLAQKPECFQQVWHLPTSNPPIDGEKFIELIAKELGVDPHYTVLKKWMIRMASIFSKTIYESYEMLYQYESDYYFDSTKFNEYFKYKPITYQDGIKDTIAFLKKNK